MVSANARGSDTPSAAAISSSVAGQRAAEGRDQGVASRQPSRQMAVEGVRERPQDEVCRIDQRPVEIEENHAVSD